MPTEYFLSAGPFQCQIDFGKKPPEPDSPGDYHLQLHPADGCKLIEIYRGKVAFHIKANDQIVHSASKKGGTNPPLKKPSVVRPPSPHTNN